MKDAAQDRRSDECRAAAHPARSRTSHPWWLVASLVLIVAVVALCTREALLWVGRPFAGLLFADNLIVVSIGSDSWQDPELRRTEWSRIIAVDGVPVHSATEVLDAVAARRPGDRITYGFRRADEAFRVAIPVRTFTWTDFRDVFAPMLAVGGFLALGSGALVLLRPQRPELRALYAGCASFGVALVTGPDQYGPYRFTPLYLMALAAVPPAVLHLAAVYPWRPAPWTRRAVRTAYAVFALVGALLVALRGHPGAFLGLLYFVYLSLANAVLLYAGSLVAALATARRPRAQVGVALAAVICACGPGVLVLVAYPLLTEPIAPAWIVLPLALMPVLSGIAFLAVPSGRRSGREVLA